jgi:hypothetical protein
MFEVSKQITPATVVPATAGYFQLRFHFRNDIKVNINNVMANSNSADCWLAHRCERSR